MATVATISVNFAQYNATSFNAPGVIDRSINPSTLSQYCLGSSTPDFNYLGGFVKKTADTMSGYLTLTSTDPTQDDHATRKGYVDSRINSLSSTVGDSSGGFVKVEGSTMTGPLTLNTLIQTLPLHATSKGYVDTKVSDLDTAIGTNLSNNFLAKAGGTMSGAINMGSNKITSLGAPVVATDAANKDYVDTKVGTGTTGYATTTYVNNQDALNVLKKGDTMTGPLLLDSLTQTLPLHATSKSYVDTKVSDLDTAIGTNLSNNFLAKAGGTMSGAINMGSNKITSLGAPEGDTDAATKKYVDSKVGTGTSGYATTTDVSTAVALNVLKAGDTMTGPLFMGSHADPDPAKKGSLLGIAQAVWGSGTFLEVRSSDGGSGANAAYMMFHRQGRHAIRFGLDTDNILKVGDWSGNNAHTIVHSGNITSFAPTIVSVTTAQTTAEKGVTNAATAQTAAVDAQTTADGKVSKSGDTMTNTLTIKNGAPTLWLQDEDNLSSGIHCNSNTLYFLRGEINATSWSAPLGAWPLTLNLSNNDANFGGSIFAKGGTMSGAINMGTNKITSLGAPVSDLDAATKKYVDERDAYNVLKAGSTMSGPLVLNGAPAATATANTAATKGYVDAECNERVPILNNTNSLSIKNTAPTIAFIDTDDLSGWIHVENNLMHFLRGPKNAPAVNGWSQIDGEWPLLLNLSNNNAEFGANIVANGDVTAFSDVRVKENIKTIEEPLNKVLKMRGVTFNRTDKDGERDKLHVGVIAQEIEEILPEVVIEKDNGMKSVAYGNIVGVLIEAIKELNAKIEKLEAKN